MLVRFVIENFLSFGKEVEFQMFPYSRYQKHKDHVYDKKKIKLLKSSAIYGANASGKSNFVKAITYLQAAVLGNEDAFVDVDIFKFKLSDNTKKENIRFEIEVFLNYKFYYYGLELDEEGISSEFLYTRISETAKDRLIFERKTKNNKHKIILGDKILKQKTRQQKDLIVKTYQENILTNNLAFLRAFYKKGVKEINILFEWFAKSLIIENETNSALSFIKGFVFNQEFRNFVNQIIKKIDAGIFSMDYERYPFDEYFGRDFRKQKRVLFDLRNKRDVFIEFDTIASMREGEPYVYKIYTLHKDENGNEIKFSLLEESDGTKRFISLLPTLGDMLKNEVTFFIDEIGRSLHPALLKATIRFLLDKETKTKGQLIFTTHESHLLDLNIFRQDEIWFVEKSASGMSKMYSLAEYKPRADKDIRRGYLDGIYGAIPFLTGFEHSDFFSDEVQ